MFKLKHRLTLYFSQLRKLTLPTDSRTIDNSTRRLFADKTDYKHNNTATRSRLPDRPKPIYAGHQWLQQCYYNAFIECHNKDKKETSISAVAKRPSDASYLSLASILQYIDRKFCFRFNAVLFCSVFLVVVHAVGCDKYRFTDALP